MKIDLTEIYKGLDEWRTERGITAESQKEGYIVNVMEELGELAAALRDYERFSKPSYPYPKNKKLFLKICPLILGGLKLFHLS